jgi:hypothetical protein
VIRYRCLSPGCDKWNAPGDLYCREHQPWPDNWRAIIDRAAREERRHFWPRWNAYDWLALGLAAAITAILYLVLH